MKLLRLFALICSVFLLAALWLPAETYSPAESRAILEQIDALVSYTNNDFSAEYTITQERPGQGTSVTKANMFRRDSDDRYMIFILEPTADYGKGYLKIGNNLWLYDPVARRFNVTSARDRFQNTNARNSDFTQSTLARDYRITGSYREQLGAYDTTIYELEAVTDQVTYPSMKIWVDQNKLVRKFEDYSLSGQLMRTTAIPSYRRLENQFVPVNIVIVDALQGRMIDGRFRNERTIISVAKPSLRDLPDLVFTQAYLERVSD
ncbi:outer membrane lipoprotein-sorting protein [Spirochaeta dissipatitropha]